MLSMYYVFYDIKTIISTRYNKLEFVDAADCGKGLSLKSDEFGFRLRLPYLVRCLVKHSYRAQHILPIFQIFVKHVS